MENDKFEGDYRWHDEGSAPKIPKRSETVGQENITTNSQYQKMTDNQILQIRRNIPQIIIEEQKTNSSRKKSIKQKIDIKSDNLQKPKKEKKEKEEKEAISKSDIQDIKHVLEDILHWLKEIEGFKKHPYDERSRQAIEEGLAQIYKYRNYYDVADTIKIAGSENPNDFDSPVYNKEKIFEDLERYSDIINVINDGTDNLFTVISHGGRTNFSREAVIFPGEVKTYYNVYEIRLRSPTKGLPYRVTEYTLIDVSETSFIPIEKATLHDVELPEENINWLDTDLIPTRSPTTFRIEVATSKTGIFSAAITNDGDTQVVNFNVASGPELIEDGVYVFELLVHKGDSVNFRYSTDNGTIKILRVQEIDAVTA